MKVTVKRWLAEQKREEMAKYNLAPTFEYVDGYWVNREDDTVTMNVVEVLKETEKAIQLSMDCETRTGMNAHDPFAMWFPKSQIIELA